MTDHVKTMKRAADDLKEKVNQLSGGKHSVTIIVSNFSDTSNMVTDLSDKDVITHLLMTAAQVNIKGNNA